MKHHLSTSPRSRLQVALLVITASGCHDARAQTVRDSSSQLVKAIDVAPSATVATGALASPAADLEPEGDESIVGLLGSFTIRDTAFGRVHALSAQEAETQKGRTILVGPKELRTPWVHCRVATWQHAPMKATDITGHLGLSVADEEKVERRLDGATPTQWIAHCGDSHAALIQLGYDAVLVSQEGVHFFAERSR